MFNLSTVKNTYDGLISKYNKSEIMKLAWSIKRELGCTIKDAMIMAWKSAKSAHDQAATNAKYYYDEVTCSVTIWAKYGKVRGYINGKKINPSDSKEKLFDCRSFVKYA